ncbi:hypothetical protein [Parapedobacter lycopersici]|uniref:hypothetical protein n=1 Tax=Parapedobacter lycopersici TaxID=1864939 RepID=UPI00214D80ED|nr:hypothetical protein [Parapedobacter lycopersici]
MKDKVGKFVASIVELFNREVKASGQKDIYKNDSDNLYPNRVELVERNSVTAFAASNKLKSFIVGQGFVDTSLNEQIFNRQKRLRGYDFLQLLAHSLKTHRGAFVHVNYDMDGEVNYLDVLDYKKCRISKEDSTDHPGKIYYHDWPGEKKFDRGDTKCRWFYPFNKDIDIINDQRTKDAKDRKDESVEGLIRSYRGQVFFLSLDPTEVYPYAWVHPAYNDADNEYRISLYRNTNLRSGFLNKTMIIPNGLDEETQEEFDEAIRGWLGAENSSSVFVFKPKEDVAELDNLIKTIELKGTYDSKRFEKDEESIANNIRKSYLSIPKILIDPEDSFFGSSGEAFKEAIRYYNKETLFIRESVAYMMDNFYEGDFTIKELGENELRTRTITD